MSERRTRRPRARLETVAGLVPPGSRLADIGSDHAALPIGLLDERRVDYCIASDRSSVGLARASRSASRHVEAGRLALRYAAGLDAVTSADRIDVVAITGLGARTIRAVLDRARLERLGVRRLVLQPQTETRRVREHLRLLGYGIVDERMTRERGRDYVVIAAESDPVAASRWQQGDGENDLLEAGPRLVERADPIVRSHWQREAERQTGILARAGGPSRHRASLRRALALRVLARLPRAAPGGSALAV